MKKFLSMLLALSVVFTYTFGAVGSVYAATTPDKDVYLASVDSAKATALEALTAQYEVAKGQIKVKDTTGVDTISDGSTGNYEVYSTAWITALDALFKDVKAAVETKASILKSTDASSGSWTEAVYTTITTSDQVVVTGVTLADVDTASKMITAITNTEKYKMIAAKEQFATDKADYVAAANGIDTSIYSTTEKTPAPYKLAVAKSYSTAKAYAEALIADLVSILNTNVKVNLDATTDVTSAKVAVKALEMQALFEDVVSYNATTKVYSINETQDNPSTSPANEGLYTKYATANYNSEYATVNGDASRYDIVSATEEKVNDQNKAYTIQNRINTEYNKIYQGQDSTGNPESSITAANAEAIAAWQTLADAYKVVAEYETTAPAFPAWKVTYTKAKGYELTETAGTYYVENVKAVADSKALVESSKTTGNYDNDALDDALDTFTGNAYADAHATTPKKAVPLSTSSSVITACLIASVTVYDKEAAKYDLSQYVPDEANAAGVFVLGFTPAYKATTFTGATKNYYAKEWEAVKVAAEEYYKAVDAAVNPSDITAAKKAFNNATYAVKDTVAVTNALNADSAFVGALTYAQADIAGYIVLVNTGKVAADIIDVTKYDTAGEVAEWFRVNGARTAADIPEMTKILKEEIAAVPTAGQLEAKQEAAEKLIAALPGTLVLTFADKAKVEEAYKAVVEAHDMGVAPFASETTLKTVIAKMNTLESKEVEKAYKTVKNATLSTVTIADKEAVLAAKAVCDAYVDGYATVANDGYDGMYTYVGTTGTPSATMVTTYTTLLGDKCVASLYNAIRNLERNEIQKAVTEVTKDTPIADVKALKEKYNAFVKEYSCVYDGYDAAASITNVNKLDVLIDANQAAEEEQAKLDAEKEALKTTIAVKDSKAKFASSKAYKNSIKLTFNKPAVGVDGYVVYMATKKNGLYKKVATVKTNTYTKKSLKKGTSYYFKVKAYKVVDGKKVYTQTSGKLCKKTTK